MVHIVTPPSLNSITSTDTQLSLKLKSTSPGSSNHQIYWVSVGLADPKNMHMHLSKATYRALSTGMNSPEQPNVEVNMFLHSQHILLPWCNRFQKETRYQIKQKKKAVEVMVFWMYSSKDKKKISIWKDKKISICSEWTTFRYNQGHRT